MDDLSTWLRAQLDDDERTARAVNADADPLSDCWFDCIGGGHSDHHLRWDPARVLAEVDAKRRMVNHAQITWKHSPSAVEAGAWRLVLRHLALPYADRPGYRDEWRP